VRQRRLGTNDPDLRPVGLRLHGHDEGVRKGTLPNGIG
jgi:hypothetical protein